MKSPFKIGDTVKIIRVYQSTYLQDWVNKLNLEKLGKIGKIIRGGRIGKNEFTYHVEGIGRYISSKDLELVEEEIKKPKFKVGQAIVIDNDENHIYTVVLAYEDFSDEYLVGESWMKASQFRKATEEELELFYNIK